MNIDALSIFQCLILRKTEQVKKALATLLTDKEDLLSKLFQAYRLHLGFTENSHSSIDQHLSRTHITEDRISSPSYGLTNGRGPSPIISNSSPSPVHSPMYRDSPVHSRPFSPIYNPNTSPTFRVPSSPSQSPTGFKTSSSPLINSSNAYKSSSSPAHSPLVFKHSPSPVSSPSFQHNGRSHFESTSRHFESSRIRRGSVDALDDRKGNAVDTTSNVRGKTLKQRKYHMYSNTTCTRTSTHTHTHTHAHFSVNIFF